MIYAGLFWNLKKMEKMKKGCNASFITLVSKVANPVGLKDWRPISLVGSQYKISSKILTKRLLDSRLLKAN